MGTWVTRLEPAAVRQAVGVVIVGVRVVPVERRAVLVVRVGVTAVDVHVGHPRRHRRDRHAPHENRRNRPRHPRECTGAAASRQTAMHAAHIENRRVYFRMTDRPRTVSGVTSDVSRRSL